MLKISLTDQPTFTATVEVRFDVVHRFKVTFRVLDDETMSAITRQHGQPDPDAAWIAEGDKQLLRQAWIGWDDIVDLDRQPIPFSDSARERLMSIIPIRVAVITAYYDNLAGARRKN